MMEHDLYSAKLNVSAHAHIVITKAAIQLSCRLFFRGPGDTSCPVVIDIDAEKYGLFRLYKVKNYKFLLYFQFIY